MATADPTLGKRRGRPRTPGAGDRILDAALEEYGERGWAGFTMDAVARRAGVGKSTVYLRWKDKDSLLTHAVDARSSGIEDVDTGTFRGDLEALAGNLFRHYLDPVGWATLRLTVDAIASPAALGTFNERVALQHSQAAFAVLRRAIARGEAPPDVPTLTLIECLYGAVTMQALILTGDRRKLADEEITERVDRLVTFVLVGARG